MRVLLIAALALGHPFPLHAQPNAPGLKVPPGFEVIEFSDGKFANDIYCMTVDPRGRIVVSGRGYIRILVDDDGDGRADRALEFAAEPRDGAMGLLWERAALYVTGDGGLRRYTAAQNPDRPDGPSELVRALKTGGEHAGHALRRGPDGWLYLLCGNNTGINASYAELSTSPVKEPTAGCILRFSPDQHQCEIVAHGFRNPYGMDFNLDGELFTFDSDNERCVSLPWYEPTRLYHVIAGRHYGWLAPQHASFWRRPPYFCDIVAPVATLGRGSPTGVACYRHNQFPPEYLGGLFLCDWTFGKIHFATLERNGASYRCTTRPFLEALGDNGFAPTACVVHPQTGDLYVSIGGRGTRGGVYRIRHTERFKKLGKNLTLLPIPPRSLDWHEGLAKETDQKLRSTSAADRLWALQMLRRHHSRLLPGLVDVGDDRDDRLIRLAYADLLEELLRKNPILRKQPRFSSETHRMAVGLASLAHDRTFALECGFALLAENHPPAQRLEGIRLVQLALGDIGSKSTIGTIWEGYTPRQALAVDASARRLAPFFPSNHVDLDRELARTLGMIGQGDEALRQRLLARCGTASSPIEDIHYLAVHARLSGQRAAKETTLIADILLDLDRKITAGKLQCDSHWPLRVQELYAALSAKDAALHRAILEHPSFGRPDHALFTRVKDFPRDRAARRFLERWQQDKLAVLNETIIQLLFTLPVEEVLPTLRKRWGDTGQETALLPLLARQPQAEDRRKFVAGLNTTQTTVLDACVQALNQLNVQADAQEMFALIHALQRAEGGQVALRKRLADRLERITGQALGTNRPAWIAWMQKQHPEFGQRLANPDGVDVARWEKRLAGIDWDKGKAGAGKTVYNKASCVNCHSGAQAVGPDLVGVTQRFARADLFTAILQPSKEVPARYQTTLVETHDGKTYQGIVIYDAVDSLILQTGAATTVRLDGASVASRWTSTQSLMPAGLLDDLRDQEIADLYAYLRSFGKIAPR